jgi:hypothetical protein
MMSDRGANIESLGALRNQEHKFLKNENELSFRGTGYFYLFWFRQQDDKEKKRKEKRSCRDLWISRIYM